MAFDDEALMAIGRVTVAGSALQHEIVRLHLRLEGRPHGSLNELLSKPSGEVRGSARELARSYVDPTLGRMALEWLRDAADALRSRHSVVHALWVIPAGTEEPAIIGWQVRGGAPVPGDAPSLNGIARRIYAIVDRGAALNRSLDAATDA